MHLILRYINTRIRANVLHSVLGLREIRGQYNQNRTARCIGTVSHIGMDTTLIVSALVGVAAIVAVIAFMKKGDAEKKRKQFHDASRGKVILHQFNRGKHSPSCSPYPAKLETFLRIAKIPYEVDFTDPMVPKGKSPWITVDGKDIADSHFCIEYLSKDPKYSRNLPDTWLSTEQVSLATALRALLEDRLYWSLLVLRYMHTKDFSKVLDVFGMRNWVERFIFSKIVRPFFIQKQAYQQGFGRHSEQEVVSVTTQDLRALSNILGKKKFFLGDRVASIDCCAFGTLIQFLWNDPTHQYTHLFNGELKNLKEYCYRIKDTYWSDWKELGLAEPE